MFVMFTECRGSAQARVEIAHADTEEVLFATQTRLVPFPHDPLELSMLSFRIRNLEFPEGGLYFVRFVYNDQVIAEQPLILY